MAIEPFPHQSELFPEASPTVLSMDDVATRIAATAPDNPYAAQEGRIDAIASHRGEDLAAEQLGRIPEKIATDRDERRQHEGNTGHDRIRPEQQFWKDSTEFDPERKKEQLNIVRGLRATLRQPGATRHGR